MATTWGLGDYPRMAEHLMPVALEAVVLAGVAPGERVLDVACGTGNGAVAAVDRGALATGTDLEPALLQLARERAPEIDFVTADAAALPFDDGAFDVVLSLFGVMYAPDHARAARELVRVSKPGGRIVIAAWTPGSFMPRMGAALASYLPPPPPGSGPPSRWGDPDALEALIGRLETRETRTLTIEADVDFFIDTAGHVLAERERLEAEGRWQDLRRDLAKLTGDGGQVELEYLLALTRHATIAE
jgi:SAM-dependent methyltransferase